jgi:hypothetical protein
MKAASPVGHPGAGRNAADARLSSKKLLTA